MSLLVGIMKPIKPRDFDLDKVAREVTKPRISVFDMDDLALELAIRRPKPMNMAQTVNWSSSTPAPPSGATNVTFQNDSSSPPNVSAYLALGSMAGAVINAQMPNGLTNFNSAAQSLTVTSGTAFYITNSNINLPASPVTGIVAGSAPTTFRWSVKMTKTAAGTGTFQIVLFMGTNGTTADTAIVTQTLGTQTAAADQLDLEVMLTFTAVGAGSAAVYWTICPKQYAASATGFGITYPATASFFSGTVSSLNSTTSNLKFGLGAIFTTGTPTVTIPFVDARSFNLV
ncbi:MAG TPA: hypothetical protein VND65_18170 [Candidatus Binatia bacterium]|nr:hypothetical protein [Candidatus Binatia bacterium]